MVFGKFTAEKFVSFKKIINKSGLEYNNIKEIFFYPSGRIDIKNKDNVIIKFPIQNLETALSVANKLLNNKNFKYNIIDLRISNQLILSNE
jgi:cell division protein FtsQ